MPWIKRSKYWPLFWITGAERDSSVMIFIWILFGSMNCNRTLAHIILFQATPSNLRHLKEKILPFLSAIISWTLQWWSARASGSDFVPFLLRAVLRNGSDATIKCDEHSSFSSVVDNAASVRKSALAIPSPSSLEMASWTVEFIDICISFFSFRNMDE